MYVTADSYSPTFLASTFSIAQKISSKFFCYLIWNRKICHQIADRPFLSVKEWGNARQESANPLHFLQKVHAALPTEFKAHNSMASFLQKFLESANSKEASNIRCIPVENRNGDVTAVMDPITPIYTCMIKHVQCWLLYHKTICI